MLAAVLVRYLLGTDPVALLLSSAWIALGVGAYYARNWARSSPLVGEPDADEQPENVTDVSREESD